MANTGNARGIIAVDKMGTKVLFLNPATYERSRPMSEIPATCWTCAGMRRRCRCVVRIEICCLQRKCSLNKLTASARQAIESAATEIGGAKRLAAWIKDNERVFWSHIYTKLLPLQVTGQDGGALKMGGNAGRIRAGK